MAKVTVTICDTCKERIAVATCPICSIDLCKPCTKHLSIELGVRFGPRVEFFKGAMCSECHKKLERNYKHIVGQLSTELEPSVLKVLKDSVGNVSYEDRPISTVDSKKEKVVSQDSSYRGGYEPPARDELSYGSEVTRAELPEGLDVTKGL